MAGFLFVEKTTALGSAARAAVLALASAWIVAGWGCGAKPSKPTGGTEAMSETEPVRLEVGRPMLRDLAGGGRHTYLVHLETGQYMRFVADQRGIDVKLKLYGPGGDEPLRTIDSPDGKKGPERVSQVAESAGDYRIDVSASEGAPAGKYEAKLELVRIATAGDARQFEAERAYFQGEDLRNAGRVAEAKPLYEAALNAWRGLGDRAGEAVTLFRLGLVERRAGEFETATQLYRQSAEAYRAVGNDYGEGRALNLAGDCLQERYKFDEAKEATQAALEIFRRIADLRGQASALNNLGTISEALGQPEEAIQTLQEAAALWGKIPDPAKEGRTLVNLGKVLYTQGRREEARDALDAALRASNGSEDKEAKTTALTNLGELDAREGRLAESRAHLEQALVLVTEEGDESGRAQTLSSLGMTLLKDGDLDGAWRVSQEALALYRKLRDSPGEALLLSNLGRIEHARAHDQEAFALQTRAEEIFKRSGDRDGEALSQFGAARSLARLGDLAGARRKLASCLALVEKIRDEGPSLSSRAAFYALKQDYWDLNVDVLMRLHEREPTRGFDALALEAAERRRARSLLDALRETQSRAEDKADPELARQIREVEQRLKAVEVKRQEAEQGGSNKSAVQSLNRELRTSLARLDGLRTRMKELSPDVGASSAVRALTSAQIRKGLAKRTTLLLVYSLGEERSYLWSVSADSIASFVLPGRTEIEASARQLALALPRASQDAERAARRHSQELSNLILAPAAERIAAFPRLIVVGDGALQRIPFAALPIPGRSEPTPRLLIQDHEVVNLPSVSVLVELRKERPQRRPLDKTRIAVVADPVFTRDDTRVKGSEEPKTPTQLSRELTRSVRDLDLDGLKRLPYTREEGRSILELTKAYPTFGAFDFNASRDLFTGGRLDDFDVIHIATHSLLDSEHPDLSGIVLSLVDAKGREKDGYLRLHEIYGLKLNAGLVVLSACETGSGQELRGEGILGISRGFLSAGVPQLVVSLWKVEDASTAELMRHFYHFLFEAGLPTGEALRQAQIAMLGDPKWSAPRHWAGFVFVGDYRRKPKDGGIEEDVGPVRISKKPSSDLPPPHVPRDRPARAASGGKP